MISIVYTRLMNDFYNQFSLINQEIVHYAQYVIEPFKLTLVLDSALS